MGNGCLLGAEIMNMIRQALLIVGLLLLITGAAVADEELQSGSFMIRDVNQQDYKPALLLGTEVEVKIAGPIARVVVRQTFYNQSRDYVEGKYLFPLPEQAAVNAMTMIIGDRVIKGAIHEKQQAQQIYQQALQQGKQAGLVEQQRPNLFTTQVANIAPQENILIEITYVETLVPVGNEFGFVFPMTLTPRYTPDTSIQQFDRDAETVMAARFIAKDSTSTELANPARITVEIENVEGLTAIESTSHKIKLTKNNHKWLVNTQDNFVPMDRDYKLRWKIAAEANNAPAFFMEQMGDEYFGVLMIMPPEAPKDETVLARETIFIIDTSGSMGGESIQQAKASLAFAIHQLNQDQRFNIIEFNSIHRALFSQSQDVTDLSKQEALDFVNSLQATGGTEMAPALRAALTMPGDQEYLRQIIFITDGAVGNEDELFGILQQLLGNSRLFTVGIGSAPNSYFMKKAAEFGRGAQTSINQLNQVNHEMTKLFSQLEKPLMRDIQVQFPETIQAEIYPQKIPDLYAGEPLIVAMKLNAIPEAIRVSGQGKTEWTATIGTLEENAYQEKNGLSSLWARAKIESLMGKMVRENNSTELEKEITKIALQHQLVSRYTSFVAVEEVIQRDPIDPVKQEQIANLLPKGSTMNNSQNSQTVNYPQTAAGVELLRLMGLIMLMIFFWIKWTKARR